MVMIRVGVKGRKVRARSRSQGRVAGAGTDRDKYRYELRLGLVVVSFRGLPELVWKIQFLSAPLHGADPRVGVRGQFGWD